MEKTANESGYHSENLEEEELCELTIYYETFFQDEEDVTAAN